MALRRILMLAAAAAVALPLTATGCGEDRGDAARTVPVPLGTVPTPASLNAVVTTEVSMIDFQLPIDPRIPRSGRIAFEVTNDGETRHALAVDGPSGEVRTPELAPGERWTIAARLPPGTYRWYCPVGDHERRGMVGRVRVAE